MKFPQLLLGGALIFWGAETDNLFIGLVLCLLFEGSALVKTRYNLSEDDFVKISDLTSLVFLGSVALILLNYEPLRFLRITTGWLPLILSPLMLAQLYSTSDEIIIGTRLGKKKKAYTHKPIDFRLYYFMICIFGAATSNSRSIWFFPVMGLLAFWFLYCNRGRSYSPIFFLSFLVASSSLGYGCVVFMELGHRYVMHKSFRFWHNYYRSHEADPYKKHVNFGETGRMKLSGEIVMRVGSSTKPPPLLKEASFFTYYQGDWLGNQGDFEYIPPATDITWNLTEPPHREGQKVTVELNLPREKGLLATPPGANHLTSRTIYDLRQNTGGTIKVLDGAEIISYDMGYSLIAQKVGKPGDRSLDIPSQELYVLERVLTVLKAVDGSDIAKVDAVKSYFDKGFSYSLSLLGKGEYDTALGNFLLHKKSGFCEYYATATALLLRKLGIPSRYVIGYAVSEKSPLEGKYIVRKRHAHAWAEAFVDGHWVEVDTTPADWLVKDAQKASFFEKVRDVFSFLRHKYKLFQIGSGEDYTLHFSIVVVLLTTFLVFRIYRRMKVERAQEAEEDDQIRCFAPIDSPFSRIITMVEQSEESRNENEPFVQWAGRTGIWKSFESSEFEGLYRLHLQLRFDPEGVSGEESLFLQRGSQKYLDQVTDRN